jgi:hypothetical protein
VPLCVVVKFPLQSRCLLLLLLLLLLLTGLP